MIPQPPPELKLMRPYIHRGNQMEKVDAVITYYCYYWAIQLAVDKGLHAVSPECTAYVAALMEDLEGRKGALAGDDRLEDDVVSRAYVENFAFRVFDNGSRAVESGSATEKTPDTLQAAAIFLELIKIFAPDDPEAAKKIKYAKFHAARILRALKDGTDLNPPAAAPEPEEEAQPLLLPSAPAPGPPPRPTLEEVPDESFDLARAGISPQPPQPRPTFEEVPDESFGLERAGISPQPPQPPQPHFEDPVFPHQPHAPPPPVSPPDITFSTAPAHSGYFPPVPEVRELATPELAPTTMGPANTVFPERMSYGGGHPSSPPRAPSAPSAPPFQFAPPPPAPAHHYQQPAHVHTHVPPPPPPPIAQQQKKEVGQEDIAQAQKYAKWAISALDYEDVDNAILQFRRALHTLGA